MIIIKALTDSGDDIPEADVEVDGKKMEPKTPATLTFPFRRANKTSEWNEFSVEVSANEFISKTELVKYESSATREFILPPVTGIPVTRYFPYLDTTTRGARVGIDKSSPLGLFNDRDINPPGDVRPITNFRREQASLRAVNSFTLTPDGQNIIYGVTLESENGRYYSNLFMTTANDQSFAFSQLTRGSRFLDCNPYMSREKGNSLVVFQSNRGPLDKWDISSFRLKEGRIIGGIGQLTRDSSFNYSPAFTSEHQSIYFTSIEGFPKAQPIIHSVEKDGTRFTSLGEIAEMLFVSQSGLIYFVRKTEDTENRQIYSITTDGVEFTSVINDAQFSQSNLLSPSLSLDGSKLLFASDNDVDEMGRKNYNLYIYDLETGQIQPLTDNGSDDIKPVWSPTEPGVLYFLSNRRGIYNIWRMQLSGID